jgi:hypothetical protein
LSFDGVSRQPVLGWSIIEPVLNLYLVAPSRWDGLQRTSTPKNIVTQSLTITVKALRLLQPAKGANEAKGKSSCHTAKHKKAQRQDTGNSSVVIPPEMIECLNKTEHKQINCYWERKSWLYIMHGERSTMRISKMFGSYILQGC